MNQDNPAITLDFDGVLLDLETTGTVPEIDRIIQVGIVNLRRDLSVPQLSDEYSKLVNPEELIPPEATAIHGISDADVAAAPKFAEIAGVIEKRLAGKVVVGYNVARFDVPLLRIEFKRAGVAWGPHDVLDVMRLNYALNPRDLPAAVMKYIRPRDESIEGAIKSTKFHDAAMDACAAGLVLRGMIYQHELTPTLAALQEAAAPDAEVYVDDDRRFAWRFHEPWFTFGKQAGRSLADVAENDRGYLGWMLKQDFGPSVERLVRDALAGKIPRSDPPAETGDPGPLDDLPW